MSDRIPLIDYYSHMIDTRRVFLNYIRIMELQEQTLSSLISNNYNYNYNRNRNRTYSYFPNTNTNTRANSFNRPRNRTRNNNTFYLNRLTNDEIDSQTHITLFSEVNNPINTSCPITFDTFTPESNVMIINHCNHIFNENSLRNWFTYNTHCPLCRHNLRNNNISNYISNNDLSQNITENTNNDFHNIFRNILNTYSHSNTLDNSLNYNIDNSINTINDTINDVIDDTINDVIDDTVDDVINNAISETIDNSANNTTTIFSRGILYDNSSSQFLYDSSNNTQNLLNQWNQTIISNLSELLESDSSGNIQLEYRLYSS